MPGTLDDNPEVLYTAVCQSYQAIDDFRMKLLALLPLATGTGVFLLLSGKAGLAGPKRAGVEEALVAVGVFGFVFTAGLFAFELYGIKKCHHLIATGKRLERGLTLPGQFGSRPQKLGGVINEPFAAAIVYPASLAAWAYLAYALRDDRTGALLAAATFVTGFVATIVVAARLALSEAREDRLLTVLVHRHLDLDGLSHELGGGGWVERTARRLQKGGDLERDEHGWCLSPAQRWRETILVTWS